MSSAGSSWLSFGGKKKLSEFGVVVADILGEIFNGIYHISRSLKDADFTNDYYIKICIRDSLDFGTYDSDLLTQLVILAHTRNVKVSIKAAAHHYLWLEFIKVTKQGFFRDNHPTIDDLLVKISKVRNSEVK